MKKILLCFVICFMLCGCGKKSSLDVIKEQERKIDKNGFYQFQGTLEIYRNEEKFTYNIESTYLKNDNYKVSLINQDNNHEQIILKNNSGVYVVTPSLNKNFKFQSDWPYNNSQIYLLQPIMNDLKNDSSKKVESNKSGYIITSNVEYTSEKEYKKQKVYFNLNNEIYKVEILNKNGDVKMCLSILNIDYKSKIKKDYFELDKYISSDNKDEETSSKLDEVIYPMYVPTDTYLTSQDVVKTSAGERAILTFSGESSFTIVQENYKSDEKSNYVYGDPYLILDSVGSVTDNSVSWISNGIEYSVLSDVVSVDELITIAQSINVETVGK